MNLCIKPSTQMMQCCVSNFWARYYCVIPKANHKYRSSCDRLSFYEEIQIFCVGVGTVQL